MSFETFAGLLNRKLLLKTARTNYMAVEHQFLVDLMQDRVRRIWVDEDWYLSRYPDVQDAIGAGVIPSGAEHFRRSGYYEHRMPYDIQVDEPWYVSEYRDVAEAVERGDFPSAQEHFELVGYGEGRIPFPNFRLRTTG